MRSVGTSVGFSVPDLSDAGPRETPSRETPTGDAAGPAAPFASMLATRLAGGRPRTSTHASGEPAASADQNEAGDDADARAVDTASIAAAATGPGLGMPPAVATAGTVATVATTAAPTAAPTANVRRATRDATTLAPALRERLGRVVDRMQNEYGYKVQIAEAGRTQARQDFLFAQGRTRSGPVVTWTRDSAHTRGRAVDVTIDGSYDNPTAFARLQQIAAAEGLHTLGMRDPGHLQLPHGVPGEVAASTLGSLPLGAAVSGATAATADGAARVTIESFGTRTESVAPPTVTPPAPVAVVASVAQVAGVAQVATVAGVATPGALALDGVGERETRHEGPRAAVRDSPRVPDANGRAADRAAEPSSSAATVRAVPGTFAGDARDGAGQESGADASAHERAARTARGRTTNTAGAASAPTWAAPTSGAAAATAAAATSAPDPSQVSPAGVAAPPVLGAIAAERIARVLDAQQAAAPRTVSHLTLRVERAEGGEDRIRLDLRGRAVDARIDVSDVGTADQLAARTPELRAALAQHGFTTDDVRVHAGADVALAAGVRDPSRDQSARDSGARQDRASDERTPDRAARDGGDGARGDATRGERRASDDRQNRRPPADAYLDRITPNASPRPTS